MTKPAGRRLLAFGLSALTLCASPRTAGAWVFEEHSNIGRNAIDWLPASAAGRDYRAELAALWKEAYAASNGRLCAVPYPPSHAFCSSRDPNDTCVDFGTLTAVAGDHSCSPENMWQNVVTSSWLPEVISFAARMDEALREASSQDVHVDIWRQSNISLRSYDADYLARATNNNSHFAIARPPRTAALKDYLAAVTATSAPMNATAVYLTFHLAALERAAALKSIARGTEARTNAVIAAITAETFALHFLEDSFAAGHIVGTNGDDSERMGTHDYYSEHGIDARTWNGSHVYPASGDSFMKQIDLDTASAVVSLSVREFLDAANNGRPALPDVGAGRYATFDICVPPSISGDLSSVLASAIASPTITDVLNGTPIPYSADPGLPRVSNEVGAFFRVEAGARGAMELGTAGAPSQFARFEDAINVSIGVGGATAGLTNRSTDGLFYAQFDLMERSLQHEVLCGDNCAHQSIPSFQRFEYGGTVRMPFWVVPGDLLLLLPFITTDWYQNMAIRAAEGGLIAKWERIRGPWQIILGREIGLHWTDSFFFDGTPINGSLPYAPAGFLIDLPLVQIATDHAYAGNLGGGMSFKPGIVWETNPYGNGVLFYAKFAFDGRLYFARP